MINEKINDAIERVIRSYYGENTDAILLAIASEPDITEEELDEYVLSIMHNILRDYDSRTSMHYTLDVSGYWQAMDGSQAADCYKDRRGMWVVNGIEVSKGYSAWIDSIVHFE